jgi:hypothetical protein
MSGMMSLSITSVMRCVLDAGFLCDKALMLRDTIKGTRVYAIILQSIHMNYVIFIPI